MSKRKVVKNFDASSDPVDDDEPGGERIVKKVVKFPGAQTSRVRRTRGQRAQQRGFLKNVNDMGDDDQLVLAMKTSRAEEEKQQILEKKIRKLQSIPEDFAQVLEKPEVSSNDGPLENSVVFVSFQSSAFRNVSRTNIGGSCGSKQNKDSPQPSADSHWDDDEDSIQSERARKPCTQVSLKRKRCSSLAMNKKAKELSTLKAKKPDEFTVQNKDQEVGDDLKDKQCKVSVLKYPISLNANGLRYSGSEEENAPSQTERSNALPSGYTKPGSSGKPASQGDVVNYYWGVPFCPVGLNPDDYTSVILCQLRTYEAVVKQRQSRLLEKADMRVVLPEPAKTPSRRSKSDGQLDGAREQLLPASEDSGVVAGGEEKQEVKEQGGQGTSREGWKDERNDENEGLRNEEQIDDDEPASSVEEGREKKPNSLRTLKMSPPNEKGNRLSKRKLQRSKESYLHKEATSSDTLKRGKMESTKICDDDDDDFLPLPIYLRACTTPQRRVTEIFDEKKCTAGVRRWTAQTDSSASKGGVNPEISTRGANCSSNVMMRSTARVELRERTLGSFSSMHVKTQSPSVRAEKESDWKITKHIGEEVEGTCRTKNSNVAHTKTCPECCCKFDLTLDDDDDDGDDDDSDEKQINKYGLTRGMKISDPKKYRNQAGDSNDARKVCDIERKLTTSRLEKHGTLITNKMKLKPRNCEEDKALERYNNNLTFRTCTYKEIPELTQQSSDKRDGKLVLSPQKHKLNIVSEKNKRSEQSVPCPLCFMEFLASDIEQHASECGMPEDVHDEENAVPSNSRMAAPSYSRQMNTRAAQNTVIPDSNSNSSASLGSERQSGESSSEDVLDGVVIQDSPIKCFRPISESPDCLIDFKNQFNKPGRSRAPVRQRRTRSKR